MGKPKKIEIINFSPSDDELLTRVDKSCATGDSNNDRHSQYEAHAGSYWQIAGRLVWHPQIERLDFFKYPRSDAMRHAECGGLSGICDLNLSPKCNTAVIGYNPYPSYADISAQFELSACLRCANQIATRDSTLHRRVGTLPQNSDLFIDLVGLDFVGALCRSCLSFGVPKLSLASTPQFIGGPFKGEGEGRNSDGSEGSESGAVRLNQAAERDHDFISGAIVIVGVICFAICAVGWKN